ncbi:sensor histidine kinase [Aeromicrobium sp. Leaf350]|uniref:sensor histidine kinase n=1 Tax=Aeromicrobium sp. Leaf350 TaxID=2876565 RepID=UPI001E490589|nr:histidine kinase [Aeromicrobium sp. Leaf350]
MTDPLRRDPLVVRTPGPVDDVRAQARLRSLNLTMLLPFIAAAGVLSIGLDARGPLDVVVLGAGVLAGLAAFVRWISNRLTSRLAVPLVVVAAGVWAYGALVADAGSAIFGFTLVASHVIPRLPRHHLAVAVAAVSYVLGIGVLRLLLEDEILRADLLTFVLFPAGITAGVIGLMFPNQRFYDVVADLEWALDREAELAVARERVRFASDLHDIQGHTLHVVKLKIALAQRLLHTDPAQVEQELRETYELVGDTITQTKELAHAQRRLNLTAELENAKNLFEAAGIRVRVERAEDADPRVSELLAQVLRETTTNVLRHARADLVQITLSAEGIAIVNDGTDLTSVPELSGLGTLQHRVADAGGELRVDVEHGRFSTVARFPTASGAAR